MLITRIVLDILLATGLSISQCWTKEQQKETWRWLKLINWMLFVLGVILLNLGAILLNGQH